MPTFLYILLGLVAAIIGGGWIGLRLKPRAFPPYPEPTPDLDTIPLPDDLPPPVARFYKAIIGNAIPVIESAVITGSAKLRFMGITFPARFRFTHVAGQDYRHYIEATIFGYPLMKVNEWYLDGKSRLEIPVGVVENEPKINMAANLGLWAESVWLPSILITDSRIRWEALDDTSARLIVPFENKEDTFTITFDPKTGLIHTFEAMRYRDAGDEAKTRWVNAALGWQAFHGIKVPSPATVTWMDQGSPWLVATIDDIAYNVDVAEYVRARGL